jgi:hypothetical protein
LFDVVSQMEVQHMAAHKFKTGQTVIVVPNNRGGELRTGTFTVVRLLPEQRGVYQYRVKSARDGHERVVLESEMGKT